MSRYVSHHPTRKGAIIHLQQIWLMVMWNKSPKRDINPNPCINLDIFMNSPTCHSPQKIFSRWFIFSRKAKKKLGIAGTLDISAKTNSLAVREGLNQQKWSFHAPKFGFWTVQSIEMKRWFDQQTVDFAKLLYNDWLTMTRVCDMSIV